MNRHKVSYLNFKPENVIFGKYSAEKSKPDAKTGSVVTYYRIPIQYRYEVKKADGSTVPAISDLFIEGPMEKSRGPKEKMVDEGKSVTSVYTQYDLTNDEHRKFVNYDDNYPGTIHSLILAACKNILSIANDVGMNKCDDERDVLKAFHYPIKWTLEKGRPALGKNPGGVWKLFRYGKEPNVMETQFILPIDKGRKISWDLLRNTNIEHKPLYRINSITIASERPSIKIDLYSSVVYNITPRGANDMQDDLIEEAAQDSGLTERLRQQLRLAEEASGHLADAPKPSSPVAVSQMAQISAVMQSVAVKETPVEQIVVPMNIAPAPAPAPVIPVQTIPTPVIPVQTIPTPVIAAPAPVFVAPQIVEAPVFTPPVIAAPVPVFAPAIVEAPVIPGLSLPILPSLP
jgi:hypothetical protein